jgi:small subunit ribosomal protein S3
MFNKNELSFNNERQTVLFLLKNVVAVVLNIYLKNKTINVKTQNLLKKFEVQLTKKPLWVSEYKKATKHLKRFSRTTEQKDFVKLLFISVFEKGSAQLLAKVISLYITKNKKKHYYLFFLLKYILNVLIKLNFSKVQGIKIIVKGRLNGVPRAKQKNIQIGTLQLQSFDQNVSYYNETSYTPNGTFGIKVWICEKK